MCTPEMLRHSPRVNCKLQVARGECKSQVQVAKAMEKRKSCGSDVRSQHIPDHHAKQLQRFSWHVPVMIIQILTSRKNGNHPQHEFCDKKSDD
jgi:hypothetical protein